MKIEIWSDVVCPFCYIGKRKFETALEQFQYKENIEIEWKSFQLASDMKTDPTKSIHQFLAEHKGISLKEAKNLNDYVANMGQQVGLVYNFDKTIPANSFRAHQFLHLAKHHGLQNQAEELLFKAYFTNGQNIDDTNVLLQLGSELGIDTVEVKKNLDNNYYSTAVHQDIQESQQIGVQGVPFFVFDRKYAVSGAQDSKVFLQTLNQAFKERDK